MRRVEIKFNLFWLAVVILLFVFLLRECKRESYICKDKIVAIIDTIWHRDTIIKYKKVPINIVEERVIRDTITEYIRDTIRDSIVNIVERVYVDSFTDSIIDLRIYSTVRGKLVDLEILYKPKIPQFITMTKVEKKNKLFLTGDIRGSLKSFDFAPGLTLLTKKDNMFRYSYGVLSNTHQFGFGIKIRLGKNG